MAEHSGVSAGGDAADPIASPLARGAAPQPARGDDAAAGQAAAAQQAASPQQLLEAFAQQQAQLDAYDGHLQHARLLLQQQQALGAPPPGWPPGALAQQQQALGAPPPGWPPGALAQQQQALGAPPPGWPPGALASSPGFDLASFAVQMQTRFDFVLQQQLAQQQAIEAFTQQQQRAMEALTRQQQHQAQQPQPDAAARASPSGAAPASRTRVRSPAAPFSEAGAEPARDTDEEDARSHASTSYPNSLDEIVGDPDPTARYDPDCYAMSPSWRSALQSHESQVKPGEFSTVNALLASARALARCQDLLYSVLDHGGVRLPAADREALIQTEEAAQVAIDALTERLGHYQCLAAGMDAKSSAALTAVARFKRRAAGGRAVGRLPCVDECLAELYEALAKKHVEKTFQALHEPRDSSPASSGKAAKAVPPPADDDDELESMRAEMEKLQARNKKLEWKLSQAGRDKAPRDKDAPPLPKKTDKSKSSGEPDAGV